MVQPTSKEYPNPRSIDQVRSHIEGIILTCTHSINDRTFETEDPSWKYVAEDFRVNVSTGSRSCSNSKAELIEEFKRVCVAHPDFTLGMPRCVTGVDIEQGVGRTFAYATETGGPDVSAVLRKHITVFSFARDEPGQ